MARKWRVAILGLGHWYSAYTLGRALREYGGAELVAAASRDRTALDPFVAAFGVPGYESAEQLLEREIVDIVHLAAPVSELEQLTLLAARAGKHMILGKPMAMTVAEADRMVDAVEAAGVTCFPFQGIMRLRGADLKARIDAGAIGDIAVMHQTSRWSIAEDACNSGKPGWFADPRHVPGGALIDEYIGWISSMAGTSESYWSAKIANLVHKDMRGGWGLATFTFASGLATLKLLDDQRSPIAPSQRTASSAGSCRTRGDHRLWFPR
jgi:predicted dehydrogenase